MKEQSQRINIALEALQAIHQYRRDKRTHGMDRVSLYIEDVEGDWLENWSDSDEGSKSSPRVTLLEVLENFLT